MLLFWKDEKSRRNTINTINRETQLTVLKEQSLPIEVGLSHSFESLLTSEQKQAFSQVHPPLPRTREAAHLLLSVSVSRMCARSLWCSSTRRTFRLIELFCMRAVPRQNPVGHCRMTEDKTLHLQSTCTGDTQKSNATPYYFITRTWNYFTVLGVKILERRNQIELRKHVWSKSFITWINCVWFTNL